MVQACVYKRFLSINGIALMNMVFLKRYECEFAFPVDKITGLSWDPSELTLQLIIGSMGHYFYFKSEKEGKEKYDHILWCIRNYNKRRD